MASWGNRAGALWILALASSAGCDGGETSDGEGGNPASTSTSHSTSAAGGDGGGPSGTAQATGTSTGSGAGSPSSTGPGGDSCESVSDCPDSGVLCREPYCDFGVCDEISSPGTAVGTDEPGDCRAAVCDGAGAIETIADDADVPDDDKECTVDACTEGLPSSTPKPPGALCTENGGRFCSAAGTCQYCPPVDDACTDAGPGEPNDSQATAHSFGEIGDDDDLGMHVCAVLGPTDPADWYTYTGRDQFLAEVGPGRNVGPQDDQPPGGLRICKYVACLEGPTVFSCPAETTPDVAPGGQSGCCAPSLVDISDDFLDDLCSDTGDDDAQVWIRVERVGDAACAPYDLDFHY